MSRPRGSRVLPFPGVPKRKGNRGNGGNGVDARLRRLEAHAAQTNRHLGGIHTKLGTTSKLFHLVIERLDGLEVGHTALAKGQRKLAEGQREIAEGQRELVEGQGRMIARLDLLIAATTRERTLRSAELAQMLARLDALERHEPGPGR